MALVLFEPKNKQTQQITNLKIVLVSNWNIWWAQWAKIVIDHARELGYIRDTFFCSKASENLLNSCKVLLCHKTFAASEDKQRQSILAISTHPTCTLVAAKHVRKQLMILNPHLAQIWTLKFA